MRTEDRSLQHRAIDRLIGQYHPRALVRMGSERLQHALREQLAREMAEQGSPPAPEHLERLERDLMGLGPLEPLLADPRVGDILVNGPFSIWFERNGRLERASQRFDDEAHLLRIIDRLVSRGGRRIDESSPMADARLPDGSRVNAVVRPAAVDGPQLSIRRFVGGPRSLEDWLDSGSIEPRAAALLGALVEERSNLLISGGTGAGKTSLLNAISARIAADERIVTLEDAAELRLTQPHVVRLESRPPNLEGKGEITLRMLLRNALRMRPDRIVLGEVRGDEVIELLAAMNTGHRGSMGTVHANSAGDALVRLESMAALALGQSYPEALRPQIASAVEAIVHVERSADGQRRICSIDRVRVVRSGGFTAFELVPIWHLSSSDPDR